MTGPAASLGCGGPLPRTVRAANHENRSVDRAGRRLPRRTMGHQLLRRGDRARVGVRGGRPRQGLRAGRRRPGPRAPSQAGVGAGLARPHRPHVVRGAGRRSLRRDRLRPPPRPPPAHRPDGRHVTGDRGDAARQRPHLRGARPGRGAVRRPGPRAGRSPTHRRPHPRAHRGVGHLPDAVRRAGDLRAAVLRRPALRRVHRPHRPARR